MTLRARNATIAAGVLLALLVATWFAAFHIGIFKHADQSIFTGFGSLHHRPHVGTIASFLATLCNPKPYVYLCAIPVMIAVARRRPWVAVAIGAILLGANVTTQLLKPLLAEPRASNLLGAAFAPPSPASWPSGHATAAMSLALACVLAAPSRARPLVAAIGAAFAIGVSYSFLTLGWHYPSDVFGGFLVAAIWTCLAVAALFSAGARLPVRASGGVVQRLTLREALGPPSTALLVALGLAAVVVIARPQEVAAYARAHEAFVIGASAIAATGMALATGLMLALRR